MASGPITSWQIERITVEAVTDFLFLGSITTAYADSSSEIKRHFLLGRQAMTNLDSVLKSRGITTGNAEIQRIIRDYYEQLHGHKMITWKKWRDS